MIRLSHRLPPSFLPLCSLPHSLTHSFILPHFLMLSLIFSHSVVPLPTASPLVIPPRIILCYHSLFTVPHSLSFLPSPHSLHPALSSSLTLLPLQSPPPTITFPNFLSPFLSPFSLSLPYSISPLPLCLGYPPSLPLPSHTFLVLHPLFAASVSPFPSFPSL